MINEPKKSFKIVTETKARLIYLGVLSGMAFEDQSYVIIDIGGGSTELILADKKDAIALTSSRVGAVRLKNDFLNKQPINLERPSCKDYN